MASKSAKSKSTSKSKKKGAKSSAKARAKLKKQLALREARAQVKVLNSAVRQLQAQIRGEREDGPPDPVALQAEASRAQSRLEQVQSELGQAKALSRKRKDEIDEWKAWYARLPEGNKPAGLVNLQNEIAWRASELDSNAETINRLMMEEINAMGVTENARHRLRAFEEGVHGLPAEKDPRLKSLQKRLKAVQAKITRLKKKK